MSRGYSFQGHLPAKLYLPEFESYSFDCEEESIASKVSRTLAANRRGRAATLRTDGSSSTRSIVGRFNYQLTAGWYSVTSINYQIDEHLLELPRVYFDQTQIGFW